MRWSVLAWAAAGMAWVWGCKPPPLVEVEARFKTELERHFRNLNAENELRREALRGDLRRVEESPVFQPPAGVIYSTYVFDPEAFVVMNYKCRACGARLMVLIPSLEYLCPSCRHCPYVDHKGADLKKSPCTLCLGADQKPRPPDPAQVDRKRFEDLKAEGVVVKDMFELTQPDTARPLEAAVRYIRRSWSWDPRGVVQVSVKAMEKAREAPKNVDEKWIPIADGGGEPSQRPGFHRLDSTWLGEVKFRLTGGGLVKLSEAVEEPLRPWKDLETVK